MEIVEDKKSGQTAKQTMKIIYRKGHFHTSLPQTYPKPFSLKNFVKK